MPREMRSFKCQKSSSNSSECFYAVHTQTDTILAHKFNNPKQPKCFKNTNLKPALDSFKMWSAD